MSWRFRKTFKVLPGVKLNLTARGLSATFGAAPFSVNVGPKGIYRNVSIPGTGIWDRQRIGGPSSPPSGGQPSLPSSGPPPPGSFPSSYPVSPTLESGIHSASTELLTSESLEQLRKLLTEAYNEQHELTTELSRAETEAKTATRRYQKWERGFLLKHLFKQSFATRKETADTTVAKLEELREQFRLTTIATEITVDREQAEPYYRMRDKFAALSESHKIWNVTSVRQSTLRPPISLSASGVYGEVGEKRFELSQRKTGNLGRTMADSGVDECWPNRFFATDRGALPRRIPGVCGPLWR